jgi:hypothetical protein
MIRRKAIRERFGEASFGRRRPCVNAIELMSGISSFGKLAVFAKSVTKEDAEIASILAESNESSEASHERHKQVRKDAPWSSNRTR